MRNDVKLGFTIGGILLAVLIVYVLVVPEKEQSQINLIGEDGNAIVAEGTSADPSPAVETPAAPQPDPVAVSPAEVLPGNPAESIEAEVATASPDGSDVNWESLLGGGDVLMTRTPAPAEPVEPTVAADDSLAIDSSSLRPSDVASPVNETIAPTTRPAIGGPRTHVVQSGETLSSIAKVAYGSANFYPHIMRANPEVNPNRLKVGTTLVLPDISDVVPAAAGSPAAAAAPVDSKSEYRVQSRDSLYSISVKLYGSPEKMADLYELNKQMIGPDPGRLKLNMVLKLPAAPTASASR